MTGVKTNIQPMETTFMYSVLICTVSKYVQCPSLTEHIRIEATRRDAGACAARSGRARGPSEIIVAGQRIGYRRRITGNDDRIQVTRWWIPAKSVDTREHSS